MNTPESDVVGRAIESAPELIGETEIIGLHYDLYNLSISVTDGDKNTVLIVFQDSIGFRVLDERDLLEFWPRFSRPSGWAFEITRGGWHDHEKKRVGKFLVPEVHPEAKEFLITGCDDCVSVISSTDPIFVFNKTQNK